MKVVTANVFPLGMSTGCLPTVRCAIVTNEADAIGACAAAAIEHADRAGFTRSREDLTNYSILIQFKDSEPLNED